MWYLVVFISALAVDLIPIFSPPVWTVMVFLLVKFNLNPWGVLLAGVAGSTLGRFLFSLYMPKVSDKLLKRHKKEDLEFVGSKLSQSRWKSWTFVLIYTVTPLSTTALFTAAGIAHVKPVQIIPPFFVGKFISDAIMIWTGRYLAGNADDLVHGTLNWKTISTAVLGLVVVGGLLFVDWRTLLEEKKLRLRFKIWKHNEEPAD
jgi:membrane protein DedA with SNARE-associated domain